MLDFVASANFIAEETAFSLRTGFEPGWPRQTGHVLEFGSSLPVLGQEQKSFVAVFSSMWTSRPMTMGVVKVIF